MFHLETSNVFTVSSRVILFVMICMIFVLIFFFSKNIQIFLANILKKASTSLGIHSTTREYAVQRYVYEHKHSTFTKIYKFVNRQIIALGLKKDGVTVTGYMLFWAFVSAILSFVICLLIQAPLLVILLFPVVYTITLFVLRAVIADKLQAQEMHVMDAVDIIIPTIMDGVKISIIQHMNNYHESIRGDFLQFESDIQDRGLSFEDAMISLSDRLGPVFEQFAVKSIYFERVGDKNMRDIFTDIIEVNRLRRVLREKNKEAFFQLKRDFGISSLLCLGYFCFLMVTDTWSRLFFLQNLAGNILLFVDILIVVIVYIYIQIIQSSSL